MYKTHSKLIHGSSRFFCDTTHSMYRQLVKKEPLNEFCTFNVQTAHVAQARAVSYMDESYHACEGVMLQI
eukprot:CAMPEP_0173119888 /NCGR_PEP_ID=MMETSP1102-20130122/52092_1 /TAXON_ID=49646 /ORGANISM="Geminigera sp., Strain Caron Lab Isolate" /LENGTH=69 /DNA_ID=CAMNT_0014025657 /DNA_START=323 /DNA_END=532 /DNA_ORIENTATION=+